MTPAAPILWPAIAITLAVIGLFVLAFALFRDRSRGRRRCPTCWYSMDGAPTLTCPECGRVVKSEKKLFKTRRSRRGIVIALTLLIAAYGVWKWPIVRRDGWTSLIPTTVLVLVAPAGDPASPRMAIYLGMFSGATTKPKSLGEALEYAVWKRISRGVPLWQSEMYLRRCMVKHSLVPAEWLIAPPLWIQGEPVPVTFHPPVGRESLHSRMAFETADEAWVTRGDYFVALPANGESAVKFRILFHDKLVYEKMVPIHTRQSTDPAEVLEPLDTPEANSLVAAALDPHLVRVDESLRVVVQDEAPQVLWKQLDFALGYQLRIIAPDGREFASSGRVPARRGPVFSPWRELPVTWAPGAMEALGATAEGARIVVTGDAAAAFEAYLTRPFGTLRTRWSGRFESPVRIEDSHPDRQPDRTREQPATGVTP